MEGEEHSAPPSLRGLHLFVQPTLIYGAINCRPVRLCPVAKQAFARHFRRQVLCHSTKPMRKPISVVHAVAQGCMRQFPDCCAYFLLLSATCLSPGAVQRDNPLSTPTPAAGPQPRLLKRNLSYVGGRQTGAPSHELDSGQTDGWVAALANSYSYSCRPSWARQRAKEVTRTKHVARYVGWQMTGLRRQSPHTFPPV